MELLLPILLFLCIVFLFKAIVIVPQGYHHTLERFGQYQKTLMPGLCIIKPFIENVGLKVNMKENVIEVPSQDVITRDNAMVRVDGVIFYQIIDAAKAAYAVNDLQRSINNLTTTNVRTVMGSMDLDELLSRREEINHRLLSVVDDATTPWGVKVIRIEIKDIAPPLDLIDAMGRQMKAERLKRAQILEAEGSRQADILQAEGERQSQILKAEGAKESAFLAAEARERQADAEAHATTVVSEAIAKGSVQAVNYFIAKDYVAAVKDMATAENHKIIFMPLETSSLIGSIGGISELVKESFLDKKG